MNPTILFSVQSGRLGFLILIWKMLLVKENSKFEPVVLRLKYDLVLHPAHVEKLGISPLF